MRDEDGCSAMRHRHVTTLTVVLFASVAVAVAVVYIAPISRDIYSDFKQHVAWATEMLAKREITIQHPVFHLATLLAAAAIGVELTPTAIALASVSQGVTCLLMMCIIRFGHETLGLARPI